MEQRVSNWNREFIFTDNDFYTLQKLVNEHTGISLSDAKRELVYSRLTRRLRKLNLKYFSSYCDLLQNSSDTDELVHFTNAVTTNLTSFFREPHHFEHLKKSYIPEMLSNTEEKKRLRIWSAGCSTGEEPYSIAMTLKDALPTDREIDVRILATDLDSNVLNTAKQGIYPYDKLKSLFPQNIKRWFARDNGKNSRHMVVDPALQELIIFKQLNLMHEWPMKGPFDAIFCRNVVIYFDKPTQRILIDRFADMLADDGYLFLGHSESLFKVTDRFKLVGQTMYRKIK